MVAFFIIMGTLSAFGTSDKRTTGCNIALAIITVGCYACAVALEVGQ